MGKVNGAIGRGSSHILFVIIICCISLVYLLFVCFLGVSQY